MIAYDKILTDDELSMLLGPADNATSDSLAQTFTSAKNTEQNKKISLSVRNLLLAKYRVDASPAVHNLYRTAKSDNYIAFDIDYQGQKGIVFLPDETASAIVGKILGEKHTSTAKKEITPAVRALLPQIIGDIVNAVALIAAPQQTWNCTPATKADITSSDLQIQIFPDKFIFIKYPLATTAAGMINTEDLPLELQAVVAEKDFSLGEIARADIGTFLPLGIEKNGSVSLTCDNQPIFRGTIGQKFRKIALKITEKVQPK